MSNQPIIIVTGGSGYIGSHTIIELLETTNYKIISIDNFSNSSTKTIDRIELITGKKIENYAIDLCDKFLLEQFFEKQKTIIGIIHFAAFKSVPESVSNPYKYYHNNIQSLLNILECCLKYNISNFIFSSSCSVYGNIATLPVKEDTLLNKAESPYAFTKQIGEVILKDYTSIYKNLNAVALRYFNPVGAHKSGLIGEDAINKPSALVPMITKTAIGKINQMYVHGTEYKTRDGSCVRDYIHVSDISSAHVNALEFLIKEKQTSNYSIFNLGTGNGVTVLEAIHSFEKISGKKLNYTTGPKRDGDVEAIYSDSSLAEKILGWKPKYSLDEMMQTAWQWELNLQNNQ